MGRSWLILSILSGLACVLLASGCDGLAKQLSTGDYLGDPVIDDGDGSRTDGSDQGQLYTVTKIVEATSDIPAWTASDIPFTGPRRQLGAVATDSQWPFEFNYTYPANNYQFNDARLLLVTSRDNSDTEAIFVDGIFTGRPPSSMVSGVSPMIVNRNYSCVPACGGATTANGPANTYFMDWALTHYKVGTLNTFDIDLSNLVSGTTLVTKDLLDDGVFHVVTGDDSVVQADSTDTSRPLLVMEGFTVSKTALTCNTSPTYKLLNNYVHNDGNSIGQSAFSFTTLSPVSSTSVAYTTMRAVEFYYDPRLPTLSSYDLLNITTANIQMTVRRATSAPAAIVVNGLGFDQSGFDRTSATTVVESWSVDAAQTAYWDSFINAIPATSAPTVVTLDLLSLMGADKVKELLLQGKLNVAIAGPVARITGQAATNTRTYGVQVSGPELILKGNFAAQICDIPDDATSPLNGSGSGVPADCLTDTASPIASSIQVVSITSTSARIQWLTNESATSQAGYGISGPATLRPLTADPTLATFHSVDVTGLQPYKYYQYNVRSTDSCGNSGTSITKAFRTQR